MCIGLPLCVLACHYVYWPAIFVLLFCLLQVNITMLQASVVEEMISFSALDNIQDLTCVSLFAVCFDAITARFCCSKQVRSSYSFVSSSPVLQHQYYNTVAGNRIKNTVSCTLPIIDLLCNPSSSTFSSMLLTEMLATSPGFKWCQLKCLNFTAASVCQSQKKLLRPFQMPFSICHTVYQF